MRGLLDRLRSMGSKKNAPQLLMWYPTQDRPRVAPMPAPYVLRAFAEGDQVPWSILLNDNGQLGAWTCERVQSELDGALVPGGQFFVVHSEQLVACAGVYDRSRAGTACWEIGWIAARREHGGLGLGLRVTAAAVDFALRLDQRPIFLLTDDFRLPAIKTYLKLGFVADLTHPTFAGRWSDVFAELGGQYASYRDARLNGGADR